MIKLKEKSKREDIEEIIIMKKKRTKMRSKLLTRFKKKSKKSQKF